MSQHRCQQPLLGGVGFPAAFPGWRHVLAAAARLCSSAPPRWPPSSRGPLWCRVGAAAAATSAHITTTGSRAETGAERLGWKRRRAHTVARGPEVWAGTETGANRSSRGDSWSCFHRTPMHVPFVTCAVSMLKYLRVLLAGCFCEMTHAAPRDADWCHSSGRLGRLDA